MVWVTRMVTYFLWLAFWLTVVLGALALALTLSGLFGVLSYLVERRSREIGIRMALGAAASDVTRLVLWQTIRPVGIGLAIGALAAAGLAVLLLASPAGAGLGGDRAGARPGFIRRRRRRHRRRVPGGRLDSGGSGGAPQSDGGVAPGIGALRGAAAGHAAAAADDQARHRLWWAATLDVPVADPVP